MSHHSDKPDTEQIDQLFLELSQFVSPQTKTHRELALEGRCAILLEVLDKIIKASSDKQRRHIIREIQLMELFL